MEFISAVVLAATLVLLLIVSVVALLRRRLLSWLRGQLLAVSGSAIVNSLPPRVVLATLFDRIYGPGRHHESLQIGILGGPGRDLQGHDIAASRSTVVDIRLSSVSRDMYSAVITWTHQLSGVLDTYEFVVFATCEPDLYNLIPSERRTPLYESFFVQDEDLLEGFVPTLQRMLEVGLTYRDDKGLTHHVPPRSLRSVEPRRGDFGKFVTFPEGADVENLRILQFDLGQLVDPDHVVAAIETLSVKTLSLEPIVNGYIAWSPPYPCFVRRVTFDVADLQTEDARLLFKVVPSTMTQPGPTMARTWGSAQEVKELTLESWLLPGHGVTLHWRPADRMTVESDSGR